MSEVINKIGSSRFGVAISNFIAGSKRTVSVIICLGAYRIVLRTRNFGDGYLKVYHKQDLVSSDKSLWYPCLGSDA